MAVGELTLYRRAGLDNSSPRGEGEIGLGEVYSLPGNYNPEKVLQRVIATRAVDLAKWEKCE
jgi:hypothetical protein